VTGSSDNAIDLWILNKKKPIFSLEGVHQNDSWVLQTDNIRNSDLICSGSYDGSVMLYGFRKQKKDFAVLGRLTNLPGCINALKFAHARSADMMNKQSQMMLAVSHSGEERLGRWHVQKNVKEGITILKRKSD
jgi:hypothetical protein